MESSNFPKSRKVESSAGKSVVADYYVTKYASGCLLSFKTTNQLNMLQILNAVSCNKELKSERLVSDFSEVFKGVGKLKDFQLRLNINESVEPVCQKHRRVHLEQRQK